MIPESSRLGQEKFHSFKSFQIAFIHNVFPKTQNIFNKNLLLSVIKDVFIFIFKSRGRHEQAESCCFGGDSVV